MNGISIIICCYNSELRIRETLEALQAQQLPDGYPWEVLLIDNNSNDNTVELATKIWNTNPVAPFRVIKETQSGQAFARKKGIMESKYEIISFVDDDNRVCKDWAATVNEIFEQHPECAGCGGQGRAVFEKQEPFWFKKYQNNFAIGPQALKSGYVEVKRSYLYGAGFCLRKKSYQLLIKSGFPEFQTGRISKTLRGGGEDSELSFCLIILGYKLWYDERLKFDHYMPASRLTINGLIELQKGFGRDEVVLSIYRSYLSNFFKPIKSAYIIYFKTRLRLIQYNLAKRKLSSPEEDFYNVVYNKLMKAYLEELIYYRKSYKEMRETIKVFVEKNRNIASRKID